jgi:CRISPR-associated protein Cmr6
MTLPLPKRVDELVRQVPKGQRHPGLSLDKHVDPPRDAKDQKPILEGVCSAFSDQGLLSALNDRRRRALADAIIWNGKSGGPLTLHLSRATALENAGIALHPIYGFAYMPGSGLKGLARAWAERVWLEAPPQRDDREWAVKAIRETFGYAPNSERGKSWIPAEISRDTRSSAGAVVFHDAWPCHWPTLIVDVVGVHHRDYYQAEENKVPPPGDWENPVPTAFLAIDAGAQFEFAVAPRHSEQTDLARKAAEWLKAALADWGAGAKTAAGYGRILSDGMPQRLDSPQRRRFECKLELVTRAFLAGAFQKAEDCDLRGATLRGQLRWWWRTMHAGHLDPRLLRRLETAIWGAAGEGSAVQIVIFPEEDNPEPEPFRERPTQPLGYLAYGMQAQPPDRDARSSKPAGSKWRVTMTARTAEFRLDDEKPGSAISADAVLRQARAALWLLTHNGGVGAKARKGFGALADVAVDGIMGSADCKRLAKSLRDTIGLAGSRPDFRAPCLERMHSAEIPLKAGQSLSQVADAYRAFMKTKRISERKPLGLPRGQCSIEMGLPADPVRRHPTTVHFHLAKSNDRLTLRISAFEIERIVRGTDLFQEIVEALRESLATGGSAAPRRADGPRRGPERPRPGQSAQFIPGALAWFEGMRVTIVAIRGDRARIRFPESGEEEDIKISELDPYRRG